MIDCQKVTIKNIFREVIYPISEILKIVANFVNAVGQVLCYILKLLVVVLYFSLKLKPIRKKIVYL